MRPIEMLSTEEANAVSVLLFDLDDTLLDRGKLGKDAYSALFALRDAGMRLVAVTGRPRGWGEVIARQWPIDGAVTENGAVACTSDGAHITVIDSAAGDRSRRRARLADAVSAIQKRFPELRPTDDSYARLSDFAFDIGEHERVAEETILAARAFARDLGARTIVSSVHLHVTFDGADKASGAVRFLARRFGMDPGTARRKAAFIGDSENDEACFGAFETTLAVRNFRGRPTVAPRYVTRAERGAGFAEAAQVLLSRKGYATSRNLSGGDSTPPELDGAAMERSQSDLALSAGKHLYPNYRQPPIVLTRGQGSYVWDKAGNRYLDLAAGIAVCSLGHAHPALVRALSEQAGRLIHVSNYFYNEPNVLLAERLTRISGMDRAFFCNSGTEALEACLKLARRHFHAKGEVHRLRVIAFEQSFHGRTLGALAATGQRAYREGFGPLPGVTHVPYGDAAKVRDAMSDDVAAILFEPVQGEGGVLPADPAFVRVLREIADERGALLITDEVQTGVGRTGKFLAIEHSGVRPDVVALAKGLGGGVPIGAMLCTEALSQALPPGSHGSTFGGNPLASAAALAVLDTVEKEHLVQHARELGLRLTEMLSGLAARHSRHVEGTRGLGLLQALVLRESVDARGIVSALRDAGLLITVAGGRGLRFSPPLTVSVAELEEGVAIVDRILGAL